MEFGSIEREIHVDATPEVVYEVVSTPEHLRGWWPDDARFESAPGATGVLTFGDGSSPDAHAVPLTVVEADPPRRFSFRWMHDENESAAADNSLLITFDLVPSGAGTLLRLTETGFREQGWEAAVLEEQYRDHVTGWDHYLPRLAPYVAKLVQAP
ncbi:SRPBCC family protein [Streptacidiphilus anmyonensis]|uniref:SRPBCC family protein n=1 Tax=Streptacidiphilus anmyonensis TaxID=405782 RepID=UPI0005A97970|nr:SRPBCC family protein [Streptacidiphilus anmyonensis]